MTLAQKAVAPPGEALADWELIARVACAMGFEQGFSFTSAAEVFAELSRFTNPKTGYDCAGVSYERLRQGPVQWPAPVGDTQARHPVRYVPAGQVLPVFPTPDGRAIFYARPWMRPQEWPDEQFPFVLNSGRLQHQWHTLTKTGRVASLNRLNPGPFVEVSVQDAQLLGLQADDRVRVTSRRGHIVLPVQISQRVGAGQCFAPFHWNDRFGPDMAVNAVTSDDVDPLSLQPGFKLCAVKLERVAPDVLPLPAPRQEEGSAPMPLDTLMRHFSLDDPALQPDLPEQARIWLKGFLEGLRMVPLQPGLVPDVPASAPLPVEARSYVTACWRACSAVWGRHVPSLFPRMFLPCGRASGFGGHPRPVGRRRWPLPWLSGCGRLDIRWNSPVWITARMRTLGRGRRFLLSPLLGW